MTYIELINEFWRLAENERLTTSQCALYSYLLHQCNKRLWPESFSILTTRIASDLQTTRKSVIAAREELSKRGLISYTPGTQHTPARYHIVGVGTNPFQKKSEETIKETIQVTTKGTTEETTEVTLYNKTKTKNKIEIKEEEERADAQEERELSRLDSFLDEIVAGKCPIWEEQMSMKLKIDSVRPFLPAFRRHAILNGRLSSINTLQDACGYFMRSFRYFERQDPLDQLEAYREEAKEEYFRNFCEWIAKKAPTVSRSLVPLTEEEFLELRERFGPDAIMKALENLENRRDLLPRYLMLYRTLINWLESPQENTFKTASIKSSPAYCRG